MLSAKVDVKRIFVFLISFLFLCSIFSPGSFAQTTNGTISYSLSDNTITIADFTSEFPCHFADLYSADKAGTLTLTSRAGVSGVDSNPVPLATNLRPADYGTLGGSRNNLYVNVTGFSGLTSATVKIIGTKSSGDTQTDLITFTGNGVYYVAQSYATLTHSQVTSFVGVGSFNYEVAQKQWGIVWQQGANAFAFDSGISISNGSYLNDTDKQITMNEDVITSNAAVFIGGSGYLTLGKIENAALKTSGNGCSLYAASTLYYFNWIQTGGAYIYSSSFDAAGIDHAIVYANTVWNTIGTGQGFAGFRPARGCDFFNLTCSNVSDGIYLYADVGGGKEDKISVLGSTYAIRNFASGDGLVLSNVYARNNTYLFRNEGVNSSISQYLINVDADNWNFDWTTGNNTVYRQYTYDVTVVDKSDHPIQSANVTLLNKVGKVFSVLTSKTGQIPRETVSRGFYNSTGGNIMYDLAPFTLIVAAAGYIDSTTQVAFTQPSSSQIILEPSPFTTADFTFSPSNPTVNEAVFLSGSLSNSSVSITVYSWNFGDGATATGINATHSYSRSGDYAVTLTVTSAIGTDVYSQTITIHERPFDIVPILIIVLIIVLLVLLLILVALRKRYNIVIIQAKTSPSISNPGPSEI